MTKEELENRYQKIVLGLTTEAGLPLSAIEACRALSDLKAEFERYIDVLEPLMQANRFYLGRWLDQYRTSGMHFEWLSKEAELIAETVRRVCELRDMAFKDKYCPHCGKEVG